MVILNYIGLDNANIAIDRVAQRQALGGHDIPVSDIVRRFSSSLSQLAVAIKEVDEAWIGDITYETLKKVACFQNGQLKSLLSAPPWFKAIMEIFGL
jgi:predicted ABC-type ATPase